MHPGNTGDVLSDETITVKADVCFVLLLATFKHDGVSVTNYLLTKV